MGMMKDRDIMMHDVKEHVCVLNAEILDTLAQLRHNLRYSGNDDNRTLYNRVRYTVHPHYCSGVVNPPCLVCKVDDLVEQWLYAQGQLWEIGGEQTDHREGWATSYPRWGALYPKMLGDTEPRWLANRKAFLETDGDQSR